MRTRILNVDPDPGGKMNAVPCVLIDGDTLYLKQLERKVEPPILVPEGGQVFGDDVGVQSPVEVE